MNDSECYLGVGIPSNLFLHPFRLKMMIVVGVRKAVTIKS
jgi:hypothetical protein